MLLRNGERLFRWPLAGHIITAGWIYNNGSMHGAIDLRAQVGTPVYAAEDGTVEAVQYWDGWSKYGMQSYGNMVQLRHADYNGKPLVTRYAHLDGITVRQGQTVREGQILGSSGNTGNSSGPHLHFEVRWNGGRVHPLNWLDADFTCKDPETRAHLGSYTSVAVPASEPEKPASTPEPAETISKPGEIEQQIGTFAVTVDRLRIRTGPGTEHPSVGYAARENAYPVYEAAGDWARIGAEMWVYMPGMGDYTPAQPAVLYDFTALQMSGGDLAAFVDLSDRLGLHYNIVRG